MVVVADKKSKLKHCELFRQMEYFKIGKRQVALFEPIYNYNRS